MTETTGLQKLIITMFALTIILTVCSLGMFFIDTPFKSTEKCVDNLTASYDDNAFHSLRNNAKVQDCTWTESKDLSPAHDIIINATVGCGIIFMILSAYAYVSRKKENVSTNTNKKE